MLANIKKGDVISFGRFFGRELEWLVLDIQDDKALLLLKQLMEEKCIFHGWGDDEEEITWEECDLRAMMNVAMYDYMFGDEDKKRVLLTHVVPDVKEGEVTEYGEECHPGNETDDYLFLLSVEEVGKYFNSNDEMVAFYVDREYDAPGDWWLRTPGEFGGINDYHEYVYSSGGINFFGDINCASLGIRPAIWIDLRSESELEPNADAWTGCDDARAHEMRNMFSSYFQDTEKWEARHGGGL